MPFSCLECINGEEDRCLSCRDTRELLIDLNNNQNTTHIYGRCSCKTGWFESFTESCGGERKILYKKHCYIFTIWMKIECHYTCKTCTGPHFTDCVSCNENRIEIKSSTPLNNMCVCPPATFEYLKTSCEGCISNYIFFI